MNNTKSIQLSSEMNSSCIEALKLRGDNVSLYAVKLIEELQKNIKP